MLWLLRAKNQNSSRLFVENICSVCSETETTFAVSVSCESSPLLYHVTVTIRLQNHFKL